LVESQPFLTKLASSGANNPEKLMKYKSSVISYGGSVLTATVALIGAAGPLQAREKKPNILVIMGDDIGWFNLGHITKASCLRPRRISTSWQSKACA
jgi:hypothetical protein